MRSPTSSRVFNMLTEEQLRQRRSAKWSYFEPDVLPLWVAEMDFAAAPAISAAVRECIVNEEFGYPAHGDERLARATADWCRRRYRWQVDPSWVRDIPDVLKGMGLAIAFLTRPESPVALPVPAYMHFFDLMRITGRQRIEIPMIQQQSGRYTIDLEALDDAFGAGAGSLILCNPANPVGTAYTSEELHRIVEIAATHDARIIADEVHGPLVYNCPHVAVASVSPMAAERVVTLMSASKAWNLPGLKCAQVILSNPRDAREWDRIDMLHVTGASTVGIRANIAAYTDGAEWLDELLIHLRSNRDHLASTLPELAPGVTVNTPQATYLSWIDFRALKLPAEPSEYLLSKARVALSSGIPFGAAVGSGFARMNFATSRPILDRAIEAIASALPA
ncbi:MalY/PatB family protein [Nocardia sp. NPDC020380]|uniref:MalY/PatB family protein n=1 Tax=Nocardia sp. NPDC020380 TaxID=3364309 RepID=UPI0037A37054